ncbi:MAG: hypothetical protein K1Y02_06110 [Candidatus Hydrogenedentes bacterium]|nr:hypothetical protein [Candidatus Hydrogenedentota bacterium]
MKQQLRDRLRHLESQATQVLQSADQSPTIKPDEPPPAPASVTPGATAARAIAPVICEALTNPNHLMHRSVSERLLKYVDTNRELTQTYKEQLPKDIAEVLRIAPTALGLYKEATNRGQRHPLSSQGKLGRGTGTAYEIMGTAALIRKSARATGKPDSPLYISPRDSLDFGIKLQASYADDERKLFHSRKTIEADLLISRPPPQPNRLLEPHREIAVDFKHVKHGKSYSDKDGEQKTKEGTSSLAKQLKGVASALKTEEIHEFHFVSNGHFSESFRRAVDNANSELIAYGCKPILLHEHVIAEQCKPT